MITDAQLVEKYLQLKAHVAARSEAFDAEIKPYKDGMATIENALLALLNERGADNTKTENGTAYKSTLLNVKVVDQAAFLKFCLEQGGSTEMLNIGALKEPVKEWIEETGNPPPGVETSQFTRVNIRRS
jgi:hypothetical protein